MSDPEVAIAQQQVQERRSPIPSPFTYVRVNGDPELEAKFNRDPVFAIKVSQGTEEATVAKDRREREGREWFTQDKWREKGLPSEQIEVRIQIGTEVKPVTIYNYSEAHPLTDQHLELLSKIFREFASRFPQVFERFKYMMINDKQSGSILGNDKLFPWSATLEQDNLVLLPAALSLSVYRILTENIRRFPDLSSDRPFTHFEGVVSHEMFHLWNQTNRNIDAYWIKVGGYGPYYEKPWEGHAWVIKEPQKWELKEINNDGVKIWKNKDTGATVEDYSQQWEEDRGLGVWRHKPTGFITTGQGYADYFSADPEECVSSYGAIRSHEDDMAECAVAYILAPELLGEISPKKLAIFESFDMSQSLQFRLKRKELLLRSVMQEILNRKRRGEILTRREEFLLLPYYEKQLSEITEALSYKKENDIQPEIVVTVRRIKDNQIRLPEIPEKDRTVYYYVEE